MDKLKELFKRYYYSCPTERWMSSKKHLFKAKPVNEMTDIEMMCGVNRDVAEKELMDYLNEVIIPQGWQWGKQWFYQDDEIKELVLLKDWFEKERVA